MWGNEQLVFLNACFCVMSSVLCNMSGVFWQNVQKYLQYFLELLSPRFWLCMEILINCTPYVFHLMKTYINLKTHTVIPNVEITTTTLRQETYVFFNLLAYFGIMKRHLTWGDRIELFWHIHKRCKTKSSPMIKRALGSWNTIERETTPLRKMMDGIRFLFTSCSDCASDSVFGRFSNNVSGEIWGASSFSSKVETEWTATFWLTSVTPVLTEALSVSSGDGEASPSAPRDAGLSATRDESAGVLPSSRAADLVESSDNPATSSLNPIATSRSKHGVTLGEETRSAGSSRQGRLAGLSVDLSSPVGHRFVSERWISSLAWELSDLGLDSCCREGVEAGSSAEGLLSMGCSEVWLPNSQWSLGKGCDLFGWTDSLAPSTKDKLVWGVVSDDIRGNCSPGDTLWEDSTPSTDGSSWLDGTEGPDGWTAI